MVQCTRVMSYMCQILKCKLHFQIMLYFENMLNQPLLYQYQNLFFNLREVTHFFIRIKDVPNVDSVTEFEDCMSKNRVYKLDTFKNYQICPTPH